MAGKRVSLIILTFLFVFLSTGVAKADDISPTEIQALSPTPIAYELPYPGILPDNPLYFLKTTRDAIQGFFISSPLKKADFDLLQADKYIQASYLLVQEGKKNAIVVKTAIKAGDFFEKAIEKALDAQKQGMDTSELAKKITVSNLKHREVIKSLEGEVDKTERDALIAEEKRMQNLEKMQTKLDGK